MVRNSIDIFTRAKNERRRVSLTTCYDYSMARIIDDSGIDAVVVDDALGTKLLGYDSTLPVSMDDMLRSTEAVAKGTTKPLVIADLPFLSYQASFEEGFRNAGRLMKAGANAIKLEGDTTATITLMAELASHGVPVIGHLGMTPQSINQTGGYKVQGKEVEEIAAILFACERYVDAGVKVVVLERVPAELAKHITLTFPLVTVGLGSGPDCDGEMYELYELLGLSKRDPEDKCGFLDGTDFVNAGLIQYDRAVKARTYPTDADAEHISPRLIDSAEDMLDNFADSYLGPDGYIDN